jgi:hypothetical protein
VKPVALSGKKEGISEINDLETNSKTKYIRDLQRGIKEYKKGYQPRSNILKYENGDLLADSCNISNRGKNYLSLIECTWC